MVARRDAVDRWGGSKKEERTHSGRTLRIATRSITHRTEAFGLSKRPSRGDVVSLRHARDDNGDALVSLEDHHSSTTQSAWTSIVSTRISSHSFTTLTLLHTIIMQSILALLVVTLACLLGIGQAFTFAGPTAFRPSPTTSTVSKTQLEFFGPKDDGSPGDYVCLVRR